MKKTVTAKSLPSGFLVLDKPSHVSSTDCVRMAKRWFNTRKIGHCGTLDPLASGLLVLCLGNATRYAQYFLDADKYYQAVIDLGKTSDTYDSEGQITISPSQNLNTPKQVQKVLEQYVGPQAQIPPMYSALKKDGKPLYELARQGITIEREPRNIKIHSIDLLEQSQDALRINVRCSKGTYIRTLADDIGQTLGCGGLISALRRLGSTPFDADHMRSPENLDAMTLEQRLDSLLPIDQALAAFPLVVLSEPEYKAILCGQLVNQTHPAGIVRLHYQNTFMGLGQFNAENTLKALRLLPTN